MRLRLKSWNGVSLNDTSFECTTPVGAGNGTGAAQPTFVDMGDKYPVLSGKLLSGSLLTFQVGLKGTTDETREVQRDALYATFDVTDPEFGVLIGEDVDDGDEEWSITGLVVTPPMLVGGAVLNRYNITIALKVPYWSKVTADETSFTVTSDTETNEVVADGNVRSNPVITIQPKSVKGAANFQKFFVAIHPPPVGLGQTVYYTRQMMDLTPSGWDTATLIAGGDMEADGRDIVVTVNGVAQPRWFTGINTADTHVWTYVSAPFYPQLVLKTALDSSTTPSTIQIQFADSELPSFSKTPCCLLLGTELVTYTELQAWEYVPNSTDPNRQKLWILSGITRGAYNTTKAAHLVGSEVHQVHNEIWVSWGDPDATVPDEALNEKPAFNLELSSNDQWVFDNQFSVEDATSPLGWSKTPYRYGPGLTYTKAENDGISEANDSDPWEVLGMLLKSIQSGSTVLNDVTSKPAWKVSTQSGFSHVYYEGQRYRSGSQGGVLTVGYQKSGGVYYGVQVIDSPVAAETWEPFSGEFDFPVSYHGVFLVWFTGALGTTLPLPFALAEITHLELDMLYPPSIFIPTTIAPSTGYVLSGYIENEENGHRITFLNVQMQVDDILTIDCVNMEATLSDGRDARPYLQFNGTVREEWMELLGGSNSIVFYDAGTDEVDITFSVSGRNTV